MARPGFTFCICPDPDFIREHIRGLFSEHNGSKWQSETFWGDEETLPERFWAAISQPDILGNNRAVILRNADSQPESFWDALTRPLSGFKKNIWPIFCLEKPWSKQNKPRVPKAITKQKFWKVASERKWIWEHPGLTSKILSEYLNNWAKSRGCKFNAKAFKLMQENAPANKGSLDNELKKLELYLEDKKEITSSDLAPLNSYAELDIFACLQALQKGQTASIWSQVFRENEKNSSFVFPFIGLLARETRILWQLATGQEDKVSLPPFILKQKTEFVRQIDLNKLAAVWERILDTEIKIKSGSLSPTQALEYLIGGMEKIFGQVQSGRNNPQP